jgi:uncharacterized protein (TIGR02453 family)
VSASFPGFSVAAIEWLRKLERHNEREFFESARPIYETELKAPMEALVEAVNAGMMEFAPGEVTPPRKAIYRIYRDTRFSSDKTPYKTHLGASFFRAELGKHVAGGYYFEVSPKYVGIAAGVYMPSPENLRLLRSHVAENWERFAPIVNNRKTNAALGPVQGERLKRPPAGFPADHPGVEWLKAKAWYYWKELPAELSTSTKLLPEILKHFRLGKPLIDFLNEPLDAARRKRAPLETGWF